MAECLDRFNLQARAGDCRIDDETSFGIGRRNVIDLTQDSNARFVDVYYSETEELTISSEDPWVALAGAFLIGYVAARAFRQLSL